jgi:hypothetical protein
MTNGKLADFFLGQLGYSGITTHTPKLEHLMEAQVENALQLLKDARYVQMYAFVIDID